LNRLDVIDPTLLLWCQPICVFGCHSKVKMLQMLRWE